MASVYPGWESSLTANHGDDRIAPAAGVTRHHHGDFLLIHD